MDEERLRSMFATIDAKDWSALPGYLHDDTVYERPGFAELRGISRVMRFYREERPIVRSSHRVEHTVVGGGLGAAWGRVDCLLPDGSEVEFGFADVYEFTGDVVARRRTHFFVPAV